MPAHRLTLGSYGQEGADRRFASTLRQPCTGGQADAIEGEVGLVRPVRLDPLGRFETSERVAGTVLQVSGRLLADGTASGTLRATRTSPTLGTCDSGPVSWTARSG